MMSLNDQLLWIESENMEMLYNAIREHFPITEPLSITRPVGVTLITTSRVGAEFIKDLHLHSRIIDLVPGMSGLSSRNEIPTLQMPLPCYEEAVYFDAAQKETSQEPMSNNVTHGLFNRTFRR
jgi:hypothetical protein